jgi:hypothetical protein
LVLTYFYTPSVAAAPLGLSPIVYLV